jgi:hypothetical protein
MIQAGYAILEDVFSPSEMRDVLAALSSAPLDRTRAGARHVLSLPVVQDVSVDSRMLAIAREFVGSGRRTVPCHSVRQVRERGHVVFRSWVVDGTGPDDDTACR